MHMTLTENAVVVDGTDGKVGRFDEVARVGVDVQFEVVAAVLPQAQRNQRSALTVHQLIHCPLQQQQ